VGLLFGVLAASFTGYLLPWDQISYWAVTISTGMLTYVPLVGDLLQRVLRGGDEITDVTLVNFYTLHTTIVPVTLLWLAAWHFWRVRRAGGVIVPPEASEADHLDQPDQSTKPETVMFWPHLLQREIAQALILVAVVVVLAAVLGAPLSERANPGMSPNPAKAPWYFVGFQELLIHFHPTFAVLIMPLLAALGFLLLPYLTPADRQGGAWFLSHKGRDSALLAALLALVVTPILVIVDERVGGGSANWIIGGVVPLAVLIVVGWSFGLAVRWRYGSSGAEAIQAVVVLLAVAFAALTVIGIWFRAEGMALSWPWEGGG
jgi:quinol-cytochrome oxidoreductase complex cytochrome b subunit